MLSAVASVRIESRARPAPSNCAMASVMMACGVVFAGYGITHTISLDGTFWKGLHSKVYGVYLHSQRRIVHAACGRHRRFQRYRAGHGTGVGTARLPCLWQ